MINSLRKNLQYLLFKLVFSLLIFVGLTSIAANKFQTLQQTALNRYGQQTLSHLQQWISLIENFRASSENEKLHATNDYFNHQIRFTDDVAVWNKEDYWATPLETISKLQGDCEDFSLAKYVTLLLLGIPEDRIRLIYVQASLSSSANRAPVAHMVLAYYPTPNAEPLVLDNLVPQIQLASKRPDLTPVFSFNASSLWVSGQQNRYSDSQSRLSKWQDVLNRIKNEGFFDE
ncbi:MAG: transglutaminase-like cysteine peptidase [Cellvibrionaceae bacterium]